MTTKKSPALKALEKIRGGPLTFGRMIESLRKADELSQVDLAKKMKMSKAHLCDIEKGRRTPTLEKAVEFANAMGYSPAQFAAKALEDQVRGAGLKFKVILKAS
ncbi:helix-turn-helix protein [compost metagenome]